MERDSRVFELITKEKNRQLHGIELIASENFVSDQVLEAMGSCLTNKYAEGLPGKRYYGGCQIVDEVELLAIERIKTLFNAQWANVQPHSGAQANAAVMLAVLNPGDKFMGLDLSHGGHLSHGSPVNSSGILYHPVAYTLNPDTERVDYAKMGAIADKVGALLMADIAHPAGLIAKGLLNHPFPHCHIVTTTTHKTLRGPRGGLIMLGNDFPNPWGYTTSKGEVKMMSALLDVAVFPGIQGGPLEHVIASKAVAFGEALTDSYKTYVTQVKKNASVMAKCFIDKGYKVVSNGTDNHSMLIDLRTKVPDITGKMVENALVKADITLNKNMVPFDSRTPFTTSGVRVGTPAITTRGAKEDLIENVVDLIDDVIMHIEDEKVINSVKEKVNKLMSEYPLFAW